MMPLPGPGFPIVLVGAALSPRAVSGGASLGLLELKCRNYTTRVLKAWGATSLPLKVAIFLIAALSLGLLRGP
jgi:hypothetical protein